MNKYFVFIITLSLVTVSIYSSITHSFSSDNQGERMNFQTICQNADKIVTKFLQEDIQEAEDPTLRKSVREQVSKSIEVINLALENFTLEHIAVSYNGGKDCLVMLLLLLSVLHSRFNEQITPQYRLDCIYVHTEEEFPEVTDFLEESSIDYGLNLIKVTDNMRDGLQRYLDINPNVQAVVVGTRMNDPYGEQLKHIQMTDNDWPSFMRIHPVLSWHYNEVWDFIRASQVPYCKLYDMGYTSLGGINNTVPNPFLRDEKNGSYRPAYMLDDEKNERSGRYINSGSRIKSND